MLNFVTLLIMKELNQKIKERLILFIEQKGLKKAQFERMCGLGNGYINNFKGAIGADKLECILKQFPDLDRDWLLYGDNKETEQEQQEFAIDEEVEVLSHQMKIAPLVPVDITRSQNVRIWEYMQRHKAAYDRIPSQMMPNFDLIHTVRSNALQPAIEKGDVLFLQHLELTTDSIVNGHIYFIDTKKNGIVIKKIYIDNERLICYSLNGKVPVKSFSIDDIYDIFSVVALLKFSVPSNDYDNKDGMLDKMIDANREILEQNATLINELSAQRQIIDKLIK